MKSTDTPVTIHTNDIIVVAGEKFTVKAINFSHEDPPVMIIEAHLVGYFEPNK